MNLKEIIASVDWEHEWLQMDSVASISDYIYKRQNLPVEVRNWLAAQYKIRPKAAVKHPDFFKAGAVFFEKAIQQSTSQVVAKFKSSLISLKEKGVVLDLTGGMGAESLGFSQLGAQVYYVEPDIELLEATKYNFAKISPALNVSFIAKKAEEFLAENSITKAQLVLLDPDRRASGSRDFTLENSSPNPLLLEEKLVEIGEEVWIKHSPMMDIDKLLVSFPYLQKIYCISHKNEVKEITSVHTKNKQQAIQKQVVCVAIQYEGSIHSTAHFVNEKSVWPSVMDKVSNGFFYEPDRSIIKAGVSGAYAAKLGLNALNSRTPYFVGEFVRSEFIGRVYEIVEVMPFKPERLAKYLKENGISHASISARGFVKRADAIERMLKIKPGDKHFLFFFTTDENQNFVAITRESKREIKRSI